MVCSQVNSVMDVFTSTGFLLDNFYPGEIAEGNQTIPHSLSHSCMLKKYNNIIMMIIQK